MYPGGTAIFIKTHIPHHNIPSPTLNTVQTTIVQIHNHNNPFTVISTYIPPQRKTFTDPIETFFPSQGLTTLLIPTSLVEILIATTDTGIALEQTPFQIYH
ncbi:hypothetical protein CDAR_270281 [Caerostris darwini]|uniref:Uncharacterized protein n=1 Tax=Caerostris darwini TaxID=1538125 RepID=A0AAV4NGW0_9ARAC|nr:hypothetical protein CDAR_270281 [Caerostris darwini]